MNIKTNLTTIFLMFCLNCFHILNAASQYECIIISCAQDGDKFQPERMNIKGQICGHINSKAAVWSQDEGVIELNDFSGWNSYAKDINDKGFVAGFLDKSDSQQVICFVWNPWTNEFILGPEGLIPHAINSQNQIVGREDVHSLANNKFFLWDTLAFSLIPYRPCDINDNGEILEKSIEQKIQKHIPNTNFSVSELNNYGAVVGTMYLKSSIAFVYTNDSFSLLPLPKSPGTSTWGHSINNKGQVVGQFSDGKLIGGGCLWCENKFFDLNKLITNQDIYIINTCQINDSSYILAVGDFKNKIVLILMKPIF
jgi:uncharacterized membrane protein